MKLRIPGWVRNQVVPSDLYCYDDNIRPTYSVSVNGEKVNSSLEKGYLTIDRKWKKGDVVEIHFDMEPRVVKANGKVEADRGRIAVERGPIVYCAEWPDNDFSVLSVLMNQSPKFKAVEKPELLCGITELVTDVQVLKFDDDGRLTAKDVELTLIPYYAWCHRGSGEMAVWLPQQLSATRPSQPATLASKSTLTSSYKGSSLSSINDRLVPKDEFDRSMPYFHTWPEVGTTQWLIYDIPEETEVMSSTVYWFDDGPWGGCRVPKSWKLYYKQANGEWAEVPNPDKYSTVKGAPNTVNFDPVKTKALKLEFTEPDDNSTGIFEWEIK